MPFGADPVNMKLISKYNQKTWFLLCVIDYFSKYAWIVPSKNKQDITITNTSQKIFDESKRKPRKIWVDKCSGFYNGSTKQQLWSKYSTLNEEKFVVVERISRTLKNKT